MTRDRGAPPSAPASIAFGPFRQVDTRSPGLVSRQSVLEKTNDGEIVMLGHTGKRSVILAAVACFVAAITPTVAQTTWTQAGTLTCRLNPSIGFVLFGHQSMECKFTPVSGLVQGYDGAINTIGIDLGATSGGGFAWAVFGPASGIPLGALAGDYVGASADASLGLGAGANVLVGGSGRSITLQPLSLEGSVGLNVVGGLSQLKLRAAAL
jgi:hypothetical protein